MKSLIFILGVIRSYSMILSRRVTWVEMYFGKGKFMVGFEVGGCLGVCILLF